MTNILFICLGNICRSPLAEGIMLHLKNEHNLKINIDSAGTEGYHVGEAPDHRTILNAKKNGIDLSALRARKFEEKDFENFDLIFVMDKSNLKNVLSMTKSEENKKKVSLFLDTLYENKNMEVPDPYHGTEQDFEAVFQLVYKASNNLITRFK